MRKQLQEIWNEYSRHQPSQCVAFILMVSKGQLVSLGITSLFQAAGRGGKEGKGEKVRTAVSALF